MSKIVTVYSLKGGSGKSTISILVAQNLKNKGKSVVLLDSDIQQKSTANWAENSQGEIDCFLIHNKLTQHDLNAFAEKDFIVIDGTPRTNDYVENILALSDIIFIPVQPTQLSLSSFLQDNHLSMLKKIKTKKKKIYGLINGVTYHNLSECEDLKSILKKITARWYLSTRTKKSICN
ncbi:ParA family protein [Pelistega indica]|uniref:ParA family protein n=1 Tax=Pelistega indica TaxID=1414851 RepID=UPI0004007C7C|nr:ParA family protein [Pelistega indica]